MALADPHRREKEGAELQPAGKSQWTLVGNSEDGFTFKGYPEWGQKGEASTFLRH